MLRISLLKQYVIALMLLGYSCAFGNAETENISSNSFCWNCNKYSHLFRGKELIIYANRIGKEDEEFLNLLDEINDDFENVFSHPFVNMLPDLAYVQYGIFLDYKEALMGGYYDPGLRTEKLGPVITINPDSFNLNEHREKLLVHELIHVIHYFFRPHEELWLKEAIAQLIQYYITNSFSLSFKLALLQPSTSLNLNIKHDDSKYDDVRGAQYGHVFQYLFYLQRICGGPELIREIMSNPNKQTGTIYIDYILKSKKWSKNKVCSSFNDSFIAFQKARFFPDYYNEETYLTISPGTAKVDDQRTQSSLPPYSAQAYKTSGGCDKRKYTFTISSGKCLEVRLE